MASEAFAIIIVSPADPTGAGRQQDAVHVDRQLVGLQQLHQGRQDRRGHNALPRPLRRREGSHEIDCSHAAPDWLMLPSCPTVGATAPSFSSRLTLHAMVVNNSQQQTKSPSPGRGRVLMISAWTTGRPCPSRASGPARLQLVTPPRHPHRRRGSRRTTGLRARGVATIPSRSTPTTLATSGRRPPITASHDWALGPAAIAKEPDRPGGWKDDGYVMMGPQ